MLYIGRYAQTHIHSYICLHFHSCSHLHISRFTFLLGPTTKVVIHSISIHACLHTYTYTYTHVQTNTHTHLDGWMDGAELPKPNHPTNNFISFLCPFLYLLRQKSSLENYLSDKMLHRMGITEGC